MNHAGKKIMIVADGKLVRRMLQCLFMAKGYAVETAQCSDEALEILGRVRLGAIVLDLLALEVDGISICAVLKGKGKHTPIIILTAADEEKKTWERLLPDCAHDYVEKPFVSADLIEKVSSAFKSSRGEYVEEDNLNR